MDKDTLYEIEPKIIQERKVEKSKSFAEHVKEQMATLKDYDHKLFEDIVDGLKCKGWVEEGGLPVFKLLHKDESGAIKIFRNEEAPAVIKICFSAEPEEPEEEIIPQDETDGESMAGFTEHGGLS